MRSMQLSHPQAAETNPLQMTEGDPITAISPRGLLLRVRACGVCHTDLHLVEGELAPRKLPIIPGHQVIATVERVGAEVTRFGLGDRVGVPWLHSTCGQCSFCQGGQENLCDDARFTGWDIDGGYAEVMAADEGAAVAIPPGFTDAAAAPLLCAGIIGFRSLRLAGAREGMTIGLFGFGASAHIALQVARYWGCEVYAFTRSAAHRSQAEALGAAWTGTAEQTPPHRLDCAILFAPAGALVPLALGRLRKGGTLAINAIHMSPIPGLDYALLYGERTLRSITNATRQDAEEFLQLASQMAIRTEFQVFPLAEANRALLAVKHSQVRGAAVLEI